MLRIKGLIKVMKRIFAREVGPLSSCSCMSSGTQDIIHLANHEFPSYQSLSRNLAVWPWVPQAR